jgi:hypothetical protein
VTGSVGPAEPDPLGCGDTGAADVGLAEADGLAEPDGLVLADGLTEPDGLVLADGLAVPVDGLVDGDGLGHSTVNTFDLPAPFSPSQVQTSL